MRVVAIAAGDAGRKHPALLERAVIVDFVLHLPIREIKSPPKLRNSVGVRQPPARHPVLGEFGPARMAQTAGLYLLAQSRRCDIALWMTVCRILPPPDVAAFVKTHSETL